ncbi:peroxisome proliferator-activated receptor gamma coactivator-related protein 1 isoform X2 [Syngnathoides biaculeatus]|uniref:peroxisome proliferator-activated receptor gamma coactivator-related protein 1 isoform X2 n=1 Tax=Syngnathoides biaculeatus TaxID=300417 RepID=UPI002ADD841A|nr:peroxisome proliferator-activated receptor gamma coactivator-related protein 1 isoform X2 [Syngnathoides biaculeatus]
MAVRWGAAEETLTACHMDFFHLNTLGEGAELCPGETLESLQSYVDPSILSIFDDTPSMETKGQDQNIEATLLTALADIIDNMDDENPSPFDMLPELDLLSGQGREQSPLKRLACLSRSPPRRDSCLRPLLTGKNLPMRKRSDGDEQDADSLTLSPLSPTFLSDCTLPNWECLAIPVPVTVQQESADGLSVDLDDLVKHRHPYCVTISMEDDKGMQMLPEGGILLEVVDQGENGEPILAIQDLPVPLSTEGFTENEPRAGDEDEVASESSEHVVVDDDDDDGAFSQVPVKIPGLCFDRKDNIMINKQKEATLARSPTRRKRKKKCKKHCPPVEGRVLRSATISKKQELHIELKNRQLKKEKKNKMPKDPSGPEDRFLKLKVITSRQSESQAEITSLVPESSVKAVTFVPPQATGLLKPAVHESPGPVISSQQPDKMSKEVSQTSDEICSQPSLVSSSNLAAANTTLTVDEPLPPVAPAAPEPKPKSLSLAEYRRLRLQKKPVPVQKQGDNSTKWPSLPELPKELPPIPCLPHPTPRDTRWPTFQAGKQVVEIKPAWQPRGPCAPPTPEALLVPPAYMVSSTNKTANAVPTQSKEVLNPKPNVPQKPSAGTPDSVNTHVSKCQPVHQPTDKCTKLSEDDTEVTMRPPQFVKTTAQTIQCNSAAAAVPIPSPVEKTPVSQNVPKVIPHSTPSSNNHSTPAKAPTMNPKPSSAPSVLPLTSSSLKSEPVVVKPKPQVTSTGAPKAKSPTQELIESFTAEMGIEAADLTSLLEQFEETQAKEQQSGLEVCGRAAAVGNSSAKFAHERTVVERVRANDLSSPAATPPHQMWKPLAPVAVLGKAKSSESSKMNPSKAIQIEARPLTSARFHTKPTEAGPSVPYEVVCMDHDYCVPNKHASTGEAGKRWNVKQKITIKAIKHPIATTTVPPCVQELTCQSNPNTQAVLAPPAVLNDDIDRIEKSSVLETPEASPARQESESTESGLKKRPFERSYRWHATSRSPSPKQRGRKQRSQGSPSTSSSFESDSHSSRSRSGSRLPSKKRFRHRRSRSRYSSSSRSSSRSSLSRSPPRRRKYSYSSSHSGSWSRSRSRSQSPQRRASWRKTRNLYSPSYRSTNGYAAEDMKSRKDKAIEERRVVYIGRIRGTMTQRELRDRFSYFGEVEDCTLHFREHGDNYGFVTYYDTKDAFTAIENGSKLRKPDELPFDLCFGGRRQFCKTTYADLDSNREYDPPAAKGKMKTLDFDTLLKQAQRSLKR